MLPSRESCQWAVCELFRNVETRMPRKLAVSPGCVTNFWAAADGILRYYATCCSSTKNILSSTKSCIKKATLGLETAASRWQVKCWTLAEKVLSNSCVAFICWMKFWGTRWERPLGSLLSCALPWAQTLLDNTRSLGCAGSRFEGPGAALPRLLNLLSSLMAPASHSPTTCFWSASTASFEATVKST